MSNLSTIPTSAISPLDTLAEEAQFYSQRILTDGLQLGRVFCEAKALVPSGKWTEWITANAGCSERTAQQLMQSYTRFGGNPAFSKLERSKMFKMLSLPAGTEEQFAAENDLQSMTAREIEAAVKKARAEEQKKADEAVALAEQRTREQLQKAMDEARRTAQKAANNNADLIGKNNILETQNDALARNNADLSQQLMQANSAIDDLQSQYDELQQRYLDEQSAAAKSDAERIPVSYFTSETFAAAVRQFIGTVSRMPHMKNTFAKMKPDERDQYDQLLSTVEKWCVDARDALNHYDIEEVAAYV